MSQPNREPIGFNWAFRDLLVSMLIAFMALAMIAFVVIKNIESKAKPVASLATEMTWDPASDSDIDLWIQSPNDTPVGYSRSHGLVCNLTRDDRGRHALGALSQNRENALCIEPLPGEWVINVMAYNVYDGHFPVWVQVQVMLVTKAGVTYPISKRVELEHQGEQITVARFTMDAEGKIDPGSINDAPTDLYQAGQQRHQAEPAIP